MSCKHSQLKTSSACECGVCNRHNGANENENFYEGGEIDEEGYEEGDEKEGAYVLLMQI